MGFEVVENVSPPMPSSGVPDDGVRVSCRSLTRKDTGRKAEWIWVKIGPALAKSISLVLPEVGIEVSFGTGTDSGKIAISVNQKNGGFIAKKQGNGGYSFTINSDSADGLFSTDFPAFSCPDVNVINTRGLPPMAIFKASDEMLAVDD